ncbi:MAG: hypothetical protein IIA87_00375 [Nanoarchaeota archaeon]|nr:hypothetical protein [Nanoarchaeota archaeon]
MKQSEILHIILAIFILAIIVGFNSIINFNIIKIGLALLFAFVIITANIFGKRIMASHLDAGVEHKILLWSRFGLKPGWHIEKPIPLGIILPLVITAFSIGAIKVMTILTYETTVLKRRAAKRHGFYSFTEMTEWHNALVGAAGIVAVLIVSFIAYWIPGISPLSRFAAYYAFWNLIPLSKLDGTQIFFGSRILWTTLAIITLIFVGYALLLV